jgi:hypothetical protein
VKCFFIFIFKNWFSLRVIFFLWNTFIIVKLIRNKIVRTCFLCHRTIIILSLKKIFNWNAFLSFSKKLKGSYEHALEKEEIIHISVFWSFSTRYIVIFTFYQGWFDSFKFLNIILKKLLKEMRSCVDKEKAGKLSMYKALCACFQERAFCVCFMQKDSDMISGLLKMP